jgi:hypothetical protein
VREPLVPVTVTVTVPAAVNVHDNVEVPEPPVTDDGDSVQAELSLVKATELVNPFNGETVMVEVATTPTTAGTLVGLAETVKSGVAVTMMSNVFETATWSVSPG